MSSNNSNSILSDRDINAPITSTSGETHQQDASTTTIKASGPAKSLDYHRQMLQSKLNGDNATQKYVSPSDGIMSPCTAKLSAYRNKHFMKAKPQSLFGKPKPKMAEMSSSSSSSSSPFGSSSSATEPETETGSKDSATGESSPMASQESDEPGRQAGL
ncbi:MAG: hypothetical protein M1816_003219 [Peltula sp. TS41687]|nr:MAG: hypothetical protein M1816_003219 [Peltula sp. TS41687]